MSLDTAETNLWSAPGKEAAASTTGAALPVAMRSGGSYSCTSERSGRGSPPNSASMRRYRVDACVPRGCQDSSCSVRATLPSRACNALPTTARKRSRSWPAWACQPARLSVEDRMDQCSGRAGSSSNTGMPISSARTIVCPVPPTPSRLQLSQTPISRSDCSTITRPASAACAAAAAWKWRARDASCGEARVASNNAAISSSRSANWNNRARSLQWRMPRARACTAASDASPPASSAKPSARVYGWALMATFRARPNGRGATISQPSSLAAEAANWSTPWASSVCSRVGWIVNDGVAVCSAARPASISAKMPASESAMRDPSVAIAGLPPRWPVIPTDSLTGRPSWARLMHVPGGRSRQRKRIGKSRGHVASACCVPVSQS